MGDALREAVAKLRLDEAEAIGGTLTSATTSAVSVGGPRAEAPKLRRSKPGSRPARSAPGPRPCRPPCAIRQSVRRSRVPAPSFAAYRYNARATPNKDLRAPAGLSLSPRRAARQCADWDRIQRNQHVALQKHYSAEHQVTVRAMKPPSGREMRHREKMLKSGDAVQMGKRWPHLL